VPSSHAFAIYIPAALILLAIPGPAVLYIIATSVEGGRRRGLLSVAGVHVGSLVPHRPVQVGPLGHDPSIKERTAVRPRALW